MAASSAEASPQTRCPKVSHYGIVWPSAVRQAISIRIAVRLMEFNFMLVRLGNGYTVRTVEYTDERQKNDTEWRKVKVESSHWTAFS